MPFVQLGELSQLNYGGDDDGEIEDGDIDGEDDDNCTRRVEPVWQADKCRSSRAPPGFDIVIMCNISNLLVFGTLVEFFFDHIWSKAIIVLRPLVLSTPPDSCNHIRAASENLLIDCETLKISKFGIRPLNKHLVLRIKINGHLCIVITRPKYHGEVPV